MNNHLKEYSSQQKLCGISFRVERNGKWHSVCFSDMTDEEMDHLLDGMEVERVRELANAEVNVLCDLVGYLIESREMSKLMRFGKFLNKELPKCVENGDITVLREIAKRAASDISWFGFLAGVTVDEIRGEMK